MPIKCVTHPAVVCDDLEKSLHFYIDLLGMQVDYDFGITSGELSGIPGSKSRILLLGSPADPGGCQVELFYYTDADGNPIGDQIPTPHHHDKGLQHFAVNVTDIDEMYERMVTDGVEVDVPLTESSGYKFAYLRDPNGAVVELINVNE